MSKHDEYVALMAKGEPIARIGALWYGADPGTTITNIYYFGNKNIQSVMPIRAESAISFSTSSPPVDTMQMEIIINYSLFRSHLQRLMAQIQVSPVLPIQNPVVAALVQPVQTNREVYAAYGFGRDVDRPEVRESRDRSTLMRMYSSVPVQMKIDNAAIETIPGSPRDIRVVLRLTRVLTASIYGDKVEYIRSMDGVLNQHMYINEILKEGGDNKQIESLASMFGIDAPALQDMLKQMRTPLSPGEEIGTVLNGRVEEVLAPDIYRVMTENGDSILVMPYGVECLNSQKKLEMFDMESRADDALLSDVFGTNVEQVMNKLNLAFGLSSDSKSDKPLNNISMEVIAKGPIFMLDKDTKKETSVLIHFCIISHDGLSDVGNTLLATGQGFETLPPVYDAALVPGGYNAARSKAVDQGNTLAKQQISGLSPTPEVCARAIVQIKSQRKPWDMRYALRQKNTEPNKDITISTGSTYTAAVVSISNTGTITARKAGDGSTVSISLQCVDIPSWGAYYNNETIDFMKSAFPAGRPIWIEEVPANPNNAVPPGVTMAIVRDGWNKGFCMNIELLKQGFAAYINSRGSEAYAEEWFKYSQEASRNRIGLWKHHASQE